MTEALPTDNVEAVARAIAAEAGHEIAHMPGSVILGSFFASYARAAIAAIAVQPVDGAAEVQQADRDAAASGYYAWISSNPVIPEKMTTGRADDHSMVRAFARHRATAFAAGVAAERLASG